MRSVIQVDFAEIFYFAEKEYGIDWNTANNVFFGNAFEYKTCSNFYVDEWVECIEETEEVYEKASDVPKEIVDKMSDYDKSYVITAAFLESKGVTSEVQIDAR